MSEQSPADIGQDALRRNAPKSGRGVTLPEPIDVAKFFKNRWRKDIIVVSLSTYKDTNLVDVRQHFTNEHGQNRPTSKGIAMSVLRLPDLAKAINKALEKARALGLIPDDGGAA